MRRRGVRIQGEEVRRTGSRRQEEREQETGAVGRRSGSRRKEDREQGAGGRS